MKSLVFICLLVIFVLILTAGLYLLLSKKDNKTKQICRGVCYLLVPVFATFIGMYCALFIDSEQRTQTQKKTALTFLNLSGVEVFQVDEQFQGIESEYIFFSSQPEKYEVEPFGFYVQGHLESKGFPFPSKTEELILRDVVIEQTSHAFQNEILLEFIKLKNTKLYLEKATDNDLLEKMFFRYQAHLHFISALIDNQELYLKGERTLEQSNTWIQHEHNIFSEKADVFVKTQCEAIKAQ